MIGSDEDIERSWKCLDILYKWARESIIELNDDKLEQLSYGNINSIEATIVNGK